MTERTLTANQQKYPDGPWHIRVEQNGVSVEDDCDCEHKAGAIEDLHRRLDAKLAMDCE